MKIGYLGAGSWGMALSNLLARKGYFVTHWDRNKEKIRELKETRRHKRLKSLEIPENIVFTGDLDEAVKDKDLIVESVTSQGIREVLSNIKNLKCPIVITSKGIEKDSGFLFPEVLLDIFGEENNKFIGCLTGPSHAEEVVKNLPTTVVSSSYDFSTMNLIAKTFYTPSFRVYPNTDIIGVSFGGAIKNIIAIACGISDGLGFGDNAKAAIMTRGLHEMKKLASIKNANAETLNGLSGMGDLCVTCMSALSRNYKFGILFAKGYCLEDAKKEIGMAVEGVYAAVSALQIARKFDIPIPITEAVNAVLYDKLDPRNVVKLLMQRTIKDELK
ncbi:MAG: glycerol-3-phosphate dehydrogenase [Chlamydiae bacterium RIFCSPHIGHO2_12_FULL_27_8]|nr:MAG: glycerol-3-phosphate dehydrogenase [Chlamydiae bacterium RIFCSPHIGHO2_12_FULL_27_8]OGN65067.1 MAG: glycerol-3-phosphate dehydrogenase [Chlamydiae bacterium RIFCSPLOWO2_01_FULL_28_7]